MTLTVAGKNQTLDGGIEPDQVSIHTADPTDNGSVGEVTGGTYARQNISFTAPASGGSKAMDAAVAFDIPSGNTITHYALWQGGVCVDTGTLGNSEIYGGDGVYNLTGVTISIP